MPELFEVIVNKEEGIAHLPPPEVPYYVLAGEGLYLHRNTEIGSVLIREYKSPPIPKIGFTGGVFTWEGDIIPAKLISQATHFFRRILAKYKAEAEVLITKNSETKEFKLFVPYQRVNHGGVKSVYEPTHIERGWTVVGSIHSHCDFSAFHSGTDTGDASDMDGVHFTIGMLQNDPPQIVGMVAMAGKFFHYNDVSDIAELDFTADTAPPHWDNYVFPAATESVKPKALKTLTQAEWDEFRGVVAQKAATHKPKTWTPYSGTPWVPNYNRPTSPSAWAPSEDRVIPFNRGPAQPTRDHPTKHYTKPNWTRNGNQRNYNSPEEILIDLALEDAELSNVITGDDFDGILASQIDSIEYWRLHFSEKLKAVADILDTLGMDIKFNIKPKKTDEVEGQIGLYDLLPEG